MFLCPVVVENSVSVTTEKTNYHFHCKVNFKEIGQQQIGLRGGIKHPPTNSLLTYTPNPKKTRLLKVTS